MRFSENMNGEQNCGTTKLRDNITSEAVARGARGGLVGQGAEGSFVDKQEAFLM